MDGIIPYALLKRAVPGLAPVIIDTASGAVASFPDGADGLPVTDLLVNIEPVQSGSGDPSPDNVRPITGWTGANIVVSPTQNAQDGTTCNLDWTDEAGTVYGGTLDVTRGLLTVDKRLTILDGTTEGRRMANKNAATANNMFAVSVPDGNIITPSSQSAVGEVWSNMLPTMSNYDAYYLNGYSVSLYGNQMRIGTPLSAGLSTRELANAWLANLYANGTPIVVLYRLATPITYQLTPTEVKTILGVNNIWADTGDLDVTYRADTKLYIDKKLAELAAQIIDA